VITVPAAIGDLCAQLAGVKILEPPYAMPAFDVKHYWHRCQSNDPGNRWLRAEMLALFGETRS
jgi:hypothetical protein